MKRAVVRLKSLRLVTTADQSKALADTLLGNHSIVAVDCEGVRLGRFGRLSLMQIADESGNVSLIDAKGDGVIAGLRPVLTSKDVLKVMHDCREDAASLYHQHDGIRLGGVLDTQVASIMLQKHSKAVLRQQGYSDLVSQYLGVKDSTNTVGTYMKQRMSDDAFLWHRRPLTKELVQYAVHGVEHLLTLWHAISNPLHEAGISVESITHASDEWASYCGLNPEITKPEMVEKIGTPLHGMVAAITDKGVYFKLNVGRTGVCSTPSAMKRMIVRSPDFNPVQVGDVVELAVAGVSMDGKIVYVDRRDPDWEYFDFFRRPSPEKMGSQEYKHVPSLLTEGSDPLLRRGLGEDGSVDSDDEGEVDHEPILTHKPENRVNRY